MVEQPSEVLPIKKKQRSVETPASAITPYVIGIKKTPTFDGSALDPASMELSVESNEIDVTQKLDLVSSLMKIFDADFYIISPVILFLLFRATRPQLEDQRWAHWFHVKSCGCLPMATCPI